MGTPYIVQGCPTTGGGKVITGNSSFLIEGIAIACVGDKATCPKHQTVATIISGDPCMLVMGKAAARVNDSLSCGCKLLPKQNLAVQDNGSSSGSKSSKSNTIAAVINTVTDTLKQQNTAHNNFFEDRGKYENYYIQQNKTQHIEFKALIFPYDEDRRSILGVISQAMSGACTFIVTYRVMERKLFVSVTLLPPVLKHDAKIIPRASIQLSKKGRDLGLSKNLTVGAGFWNTENDKQPVGSCTIELPEPDLQIIDVKLTLGYQAKFDAGGAVPNPPHTVHTFILNSASRRII